MVVFSNIFTPDCESLFCLPQATSRWKPPGYPQPFQAGPPSLRLGQRRLKDPADTPGLALILQILVVKNLERDIV